MSINQITTKVCIIGAGLAGLLTANILHKYGIECVVLEKCSESEIYARSSVGLIDQKTLTILQEHGLSDRLLREGIPQAKCEFRTLEENFILDYGKKCRGQIHYAYPQQELIVDLIDKLQQAGGEILFDTEATAIDNQNQGARVKCQRKGQALAINCDFIAGCDGFSGITRASLPAAIAQPRSKYFDYAWLAVTVEATPSSKHTIYGIHPNGFAGHILRNEKSSCYYLQIPMQDTAADWSSNRIWNELQLRLAREDWTLTTGKIVTKQVLKMQSFITQTMQDRRLFLAGDSAHIVNPAGGKGLNLAIQDADVLGEALTSYYRLQNNLPLKHYSATRLPEIRKTQQFCESLLHMINLQDDRSAESKSIKRVQQFKRSQLMHSEIYALDFARKYVGYTASEQPVSNFSTNGSTLPTLAIV